MMRRTDIMSMASQPRQSAVAALVHMESVPCACMHAAQLRGLARFHAARFPPMHCRGF